MTSLVKCHDYLPSADASSIYPRKQAKKRSEIPKKSLRSCPYRHPLFLFLKQWSKWGTFSTGDRKNNICVSKM
ncbi:hypothetical protein CDAR_524561 [Caerostris darwini]|uniref:Ycf15 n=1 Tax=Caerostris darwini TaxID=1538125 RepID=A0AAV4PW85_9ARAC|nr:hypothetical protein CDAR_524561 [Caerostris darwini]